MPITQFTYLHSLALNFGSLILGSKQETSGLTVPSIFEVVRKLVEHDVPFDAKQKYYEDSYLPFVIANFQSLCALDQFDLAYNMKEKGVEDIVTSNVDGQILGFTFNGENTMLLRLTKERSTFSKRIVKLKFETKSLIIILKTCKNKFI